MPETPDMGEATASLFSALKCWDSPENLRRNIASAGKRGLPPVTPADAHDGHLAIVGSAPSLAGNLDAIKAHGGEIACVNGAHDWLIERGVVPDICVLLDSTRHHIVTPHAKVKYWFASQCHPAIFDMFDNVELWHANVPFETLDCDITDLLATETDTTAWLINGGATAALRALSLGKFRGYRRMTLYGLDSSYHGDGSHHVTPEMERHGSIIEIEYGGRTFITSPGFAAQADQFQQMYLAPLNDCRLDVIGEGLMPYMCERLNQLKYGEKYAA